jgi:hypothetical protein
MGKAPAHWRHRGLLLRLSRPPGWWFPQETLRLEPNAICTFGQTMVQPGKLVPEGRSKGLTTGKRPNDGSKTAKQWFKSQSSLAPPTKSRPWPGEQAPLAFSAPREKRQKRRRDRDRGNQNQADIRGNAKRGRIRPAGRHWRRTPWQSTRTYNGLPDPLTPSKSASRTRTPDPRSLHDC